MMVHNFSVPQKTRRIKKKLSIEAARVVPIENSSNLIYNLHGQNIAGFNTHESELDIN